MALNQVQTGAASVMFLTSCAINNALVQTYLTNLDLFAKEMGIMGITSQVQQKVLQDEGKQQLSMALSSGVGQIVAGGLGGLTSMYGEYQAGKAANEVQSQQGVNVSGEEVVAPTDSEVKNPAGSGAQGTATVGNNPATGPDGAKVEATVSDSTAASKSGANANEKAVTESNIKKTDADNQTKAQEAANSVRMKYSNVYAPMVRDLAGGLGTAISGIYQNKEKADEANGVDCSSASQAASSEAGIASAAMGNAQSMLQTNGGSFSSIIQVSTARV